MAAILQQGETQIRDAFKTLITDLCVSDDTTAFADTQTGINPNATGTSTHVETVTEVDVDYRTTDFSITIVGASEFTGKVIECLGVAKGKAIRSATGSGGTHTGSGTVGTDLTTRTRRPTGLGIGVASGDTQTVTVRAQQQDNSA